MTDILLYSIIVSVILFGLISLIVIITRRKEKADKESSLNKSIVDLIKQKASLAKDINNEQDHSIIPVDRLPSNFEVSDNSLHEITNANIITRISSLTPAIRNAMGKVETVTTNTTSTIKGDFYKVVLKEGENLSTVKGKDNVYRAWSKGVGNRIKEHAQLVKQNPKVVNKATKTTKMATSASANIMNAASLVVGQYYMSQVNTQLEHMEKAVSEISDFQKTEYKSRIRSLIANVGDISNFVEEIFEDDTIRNNKLIHLQNLQEKGTQLLEQVNLSIEEYLHERVDLDFKTYVESVNELESLVNFQEILLEVLNEIARSNFTLGKGKISEENSLSLFRIYSESSQRIYKELTDWHKTQMEKQKIYLEEQKLRKRGIEGAVTSVTGLLKDDWRYSDLETDLASKITNQISFKEIKSDNKNSNLYEEDVQLLIRDGKAYFWLPEKSVSKERRN